MGAMWYHLVQGGADMTLNKPALHRCLHDDEAARRDWIISVLAAIVLRTTSFVKQEDRPRQCDQQPQQDPERRRGVPCLLMESIPR